MTIAPEDIASTLIQYLDETFAVHKGIYLDKQNSLLETLETVSAAEASIPVGGKCGSLAAQVAHVVFYIENFERYALQGDDTPPDWGQVWRTVEKVSEEEWQAYKDQLRAAYERMRGLFERNPLWSGDTIGGALSIVIHSAYHLGEIRQALCTLKQ